MDPWVLLFPPPASVAINTMTAISFLAMSHGGFKEMRGQNLQYSKMLKQNDVKAKVRSKIGMIAAYTPAFLAAISSLSIFPFSNFRFTLLRSALSLHFFKRLFEVLFVHKFSGCMDVEAMVPISISYFLSTTTLIYNQQLTFQLPEPAIDLNYIGVSLFLLGISGNFYHHYLLSKLRSSGEKQYKIPQGGLFSLVICPHYLFEILEFWGISCISQTLYAFMFTIGTTFYLVGRSYATRKWYQSKFEDFPKDVKAIIPYIF